MSSEKLREAFSWCVSGKRVTAREGQRAAVRAGAEPRCLFRDEGFPVRHGCSTAPVAAIEMGIEVGRENRDCEEKLTATEQNQKVAVGAHWKKKDSGS